MPYDAKFRDAPKQGTHENHNIDCFVKLWALNHLRVWPIFTHINNLSEHIGQIRCGEDNTQMIMGIIAEISEKLERKYGNDRLIILSVHYAYNRTSRSTCAYFDFSKEEIRKTKEEVRIIVKNILKSKVS